MLEIARADYRPSGDHLSSFNNYWDTSYFEQPVKFDPILSAEANRLRDQHIELYLQISSIAEKTEEMLYPKFNENIYVRQVEKFKEFYNAFQEHEAAEFTLIMSVLSGQQKRSRSPVSTYQEM